MSKSSHNAAIDIDETPFGRVITLDGPFGRAVVHEHGAHVTSWIPAGGEEVLFLSREARIDGRTAIRGGVPVIFPQFGPGPITRHGFARTVRWTLEDRGVNDDGSPMVVLTLVDDAATRATWPHAFHLQLTISVGPALTMQLRVGNTGDAPFSFTGALHTYLRVGDVTRASVRGLAGRHLQDKLTGDERVEGDVPLRLAGPVDRVYGPAPAGPLLVRDEAMGRTVRIEVRGGLTDVVVWNPWIEGARAFDDMADDEWREMLCVEPASVVPVAIAPGAAWAGEQRLDIVRS